MSAQDLARPTWPLRGSGASRLSAVVVVALFIAYAVPGLVGHDPWKPDEPYTFGIVHHMLKTGDWIVPMTGGEPFVEKPPLYYWVSWATALLASPWLAEHDGARLASGVFLLVGVASIAAAARLCWGEGTARFAALLTLGTLGLEGHAQRMQVDIALMAGFALCALGFSACICAKRWAGVALGLGAGMGFLAKGLFAPTVIGLTALLLPAFFLSWRRRHYFVHLAVASAVALPELLIWPIALFDRSQSLFVEWFWDNNIGRFLGFSVPWLGAAYEPGSWSETLPWFLFPLWIYALGALLAERNRALEGPGMQIGLTMALVTAIVLGTSASMRAVYILPVIPPLVLVAVAALRTPQGGAGKALGVFAIFLGAAAIVAVWGVWAALVVTGEIPAWKPLAQRLPLPFAMPLSIPAVASAALLSAGFVWLVRARHRLAAAGLTLWVAALALAWGLGMTLWLPWLDAAKSYRTVYAELAQHLPSDIACVVMDGAGESERAMVEYFIGAMPRERHVREKECGAFLWIGGADHEDRPRAPEWRSVWSGSRPGEKTERFELFLRGEKGAPEGAPPP